MFTAGDKLEFGHYRILKELGSGGMGVVYLCRDEYLQREIAIKMLLPELLSDRDTVEHFKQEARLAAKLEHPNIVTILNIGMENREGVIHHYIAMEYVPGGSLRSQIGKANPIEQRINWMTQLCSALNYAHKRNVVHQDIKPDNVFLTQDGNLKLGDFGLAMIAAGHSLDRHMQGKGSPAYMSPELCRGEETDHRSDIYSLGAVFFEMLTGEMPFKASSVDEMVQKHLNAQIPPASKLNPEIPPVLDKVIRYMMAKQPAQRLQTLGDLLPPLEKLLLEMKATRLGVLVARKKSDAEKPQPKPEAEKTAEKEKIEKSEKAEKAENVEKAEKAEKEEKAEKFEKAGKDENEEKAERSVKSEPKEEEPRKAEAKKELADSLSRNKEEEKEQKEQKEQKLSRSSDLEPAAKAKLEAEEDDRAEKAKDKEPESKLVKEEKAEKAEKTEKEEDAKKTVQEPDRKAADESSSGSEKQVRKEAAPEKNPSAAKDPESIATKDARPDKVGDEEKKGKESPEPASANQASAKEAGAKAPPQPLKPKVEKHPVELQPEKEKKLEQLWTFKTHGPIGWQAMPVASKNRKQVYLCSADGAVYCLDAANGSMLWYYDTGAPLVSGVCLVGDDLACGSSDGSMHLIDSNGKSKWKVQSTSPIVSSPALAKDSILIGALDGSLKSLNLQDGALRWVYKCEQGIVSSPQVVENMAFVGSKDSKLHALEIEGGQRQWISQTTGPLFASVLASTDSVYCATGTGEIVSIDISSGNRVWTWEGDSSFLCRGNLEFSSLNYCSKDGGLVSLDKFKGNMIWRADAVGPVIGGVASMTGSLYLSNRAGILHCFNGKTGELNWHTNFGCQLESSPLISAGSILQGTVSGELQAFSLPQKAK